VKIETYLNNLKSKFENDGYLHLESIIDKKNLNIILKKSLKFQKDRKIGNTKYLQIHKVVPEVNLIYKNKYLQFLLKYILDYKNIYGLQSEFFFNPPGTKGYGQHQDDFFLKTGRDNSFNLWIPLVNTNRLNGTLNFAKKSHKLKINKKANIFNLDGVGKKDKSLDKFNNTNCNCKFGDAIVISNHIFHGSGANKSKKNRYVLALGFINNTERYVPGKTAKRKPFNI